MTTTVLGYRSEQRSADLRTFNGEVLTPVFGEKRTGLHRWLSPGSLLAEVLSHLADGLILVEDLIEAPVELLDDLQV